jgi:hypothetical protein
VAVIGDQQTARAAELLALALESSLGRRLQEALSEAALELSAQLEHGGVEVRVAGNDQQLVYFQEPDSRSPETGGELFSARITLRLPESLKSRLETAAAAGGVSVNTWLVQRLGRLLETRPSTAGGRRLTGYGQS